uniref:Uncharacterized protein n=1 Tax=Cacopsylla melanoneura TaxID=428564 RepID=A0A8D9AGI2_9HEMI
MLISGAASRGPLCCPPDHYRAPAAPICSRPAARQEISRQTPSALDREVHQAPVSPPRGPLCSRQAQEGPRDRTSPLTDPLVCSRLVDRLRPTLADLWALQGGLMDQWVPQDPWGHPVAAL